MGDSGPWTCRLDATALDCRVAEWQTAADQGLVLREATPTGVRLSFQPEAAVTHALLDLVQAERACCDFATWTLTATEDGTVVTATTQGEGIALLQGLFEVTD